MTILYKAEWGSDIKDNILRAKEDAVNNANVVFEQNEVVVVVTAFTDLEACYQNYHNALENNLPACW